MSPAETACFCKGTYTGIKLSPREAVSFILNVFGAQAAPSCSCYEYLRVWEESSLFLSLCTSTAPCVTDALCDMMHAARSSDVFYMTYVRIINVYLAHHFRARVSSPRLLDEIQLTLFLAFAIVIISILKQNINAYQHTFKNLWICKEIRYIKFLILH